MIWAAGNFIAAEYKHNKIMPFGGGKPGQCDRRAWPVKANLGTTLKHFDGDISGVRMALDIGVKITIKVAHGANIEILVTATFEQESSCQH